MSNIYFKVTIEKNWRSQNFDKLFKNFTSLKNLSQLKNQRPGSKNVWGFSVSLYLKGIMTF